MFSFASHEFNELRENSGGGGFDFTGISQTAALTKSSRVKIIADKIRVPQAEEQAARAVRRPRLFAHLEKSLAHFSATFLTGRTGTGKTALASDFARRNLESEDYAAVAWYKADATDGEWTTFLSYFTESLKTCGIGFAKPKSKKTPAQISDGENESVTVALDNLFAALDCKKPLLIVLDNLHSVFDAEWFAEFFNALLSLPAANARVLMLARTPPPFPLWRFRSKHALDVLDEKLLAFTAEETVELFENYKLPQTTARTAHKIAYGKIAKLKEIAEKKR